LFAQDILLNLPLCRAGNSGIEHIVVVMMENRSFDTFSVGCQMRTASKLDCRTWNTRREPATHSLSGDYTGCPHPDPTIPTRRPASSMTRIDGRISPRWQQ